MILRLMYLNEYIFKNFNISNIMGSSVSSTNFVSNKDNDYNPFSIPSFSLDKPSDMNGAIAVSGCPPLHPYKKCEFAKLTIEKMAAYADGVVRGSYQNAWFINDNKKSTIKDLAECNSSAIGGLAYYYLKTNDERSLSLITEWIELNKDSQEQF